MIVWRWYIVEEERPGEECTATFVVFLNGHMTGNCVRARSVWWERILYVAESRALMSELYCTLCN